jgi:hypothetical protein
MSRSRGSLEVGLEWWSGHGTIGPEPIEVWPTPEFVDMDYDRPSAVLTDIDYTSLRTLEGISAALLRSRAATRCGYSLRRSISQDGPGYSRTRSYGACPGNRRCLASGSA